MKGHLRKRGEKSWSIVLELGRDTDGRRRQRWHTVKGTKKDAEKELARLVHTLNTGMYVEPTRLTVSRYLDQWLSNYARSNVAAKTFERYEEIVRVHLAPALGKLLLTKLQPLHIQTYYGEALISGRRQREGGLSPQTVLHHHRVRREALQQAVRWQLIARNPADAVEPPRPQSREMNALDEKQTARLLEAAKDTRVYVPILLAVTTGLRRGELLALQWQDCDLEIGALAVRRSLEQTRAGGVAFKQPKTQKGRRVIALPQLAVEALRRHRVEQAKHRLALSAVYEDHGLIFPAADGSPWSPGAFSRAYGVFVRKLGMPSVRFHDLRHSHATQLLRQGIHPKIVSERLGHCTVGITLDVYSHVLPGMQQEAAQRIGAALQAALDSLA